MTRLLIVDIDDNSDPSSNNHTFENVHADAIMKSADWIESTLFREKAINPTTCAYVAISSIQIRMMG